MPSVRTPPRLIATPAELRLLARFAGPCYTVQPAFERCRASADFARSSRDGWPIFEGMTLMKMIEKARGDLANKTSKVHQSSQP